MIKIDKENWKVETDCKTVGEFMTEAAAMFYYCVINVDGCRYEFKDSPKVRVTDNTPIGSVTMDGNGDIFITTKPQPKPKIVKKSGWVNLYRTELGNYCIIGKVYGMENDCYTDPARKEMIINAEFVTTAKIEWEEEIR